MTSILRVGGVLRLTEMGEIKAQLAEEAEADRRMMEGETVEPQSSLPPALFDSIFGLVVGSAHAQEASAAQAWTDEVTFSLEPGQGT